MDKKVLTIQDISCLGQCSLTVALPIISACGIETVILPSAILSTHTGGFSGYTFRDLTQDMPDIAKHWQKENIKFDAVYTGYLGSTEQIDYIHDIFDTLLLDTAIKIVDPAMADNGNLYYGFDEEYVRKMRTLLKGADVVLPNITEACFLTESEYISEGYSEEYIENLINKLIDNGAKAVVLTGVSYESDKLGVAVKKSANDKTKYYFHEKIQKGSHGTGDVYASAFVGAVLNSFSYEEAAKLAADYTVRCIKTTRKDEEHWYGVKFEKEIPYLVNEINNK